MSVRNECVFCGEPVADWENEADAHNDYWHKLSLAIGPFHRECHRDACGSGWLYLVERLGERIRKLEEAVAAQRTREASR